MTAKAFDRSKFQGTKLNLLRNQAKEVEQIDQPTNYDKKFLDYHKVLEGINEFRIMPALNPEELSYYPKYTSWLEIEQPSQKEEGKTEIIRKPIFIATVHSEVLKKKKKDPILLYIKKAQEMASEFSDKEDKKNFLDPIFGGWGSDYDGIIPNLTHACYAIKNNQLGNFDIEPRDKDEMEKITALMEEESGELFEFDIFSNPDEGFPLIIRKVKNTDTKNKNKKWDRTVSAANPKRGENWKEFFERTKITDEQLQELSKQQSLKERFVDCYSKRDFDLAIDGLKRFDEKYKFGIFNDSEFLDELKEIEALVPEPKQKEDKDIKDAFDSKKSPEFTRIKAKKLLKAYIEDNYPDQQEEYNGALNNLSEAELKEWYNLALNDEELPELGEQVEEEMEDEIEAPEGAEVEEVETEEVSELEKLRMARRSRKK